MRRYLIWISAGLVVTQIWISSTRTISHFFGLISGRALSHDASNENLSAFEKFNYFKLK